MIMTAHSINNYLVIGHIISETKHINHAPDAAAVEVVKVVAKMKTKAVNSIADSSRKIVASSIENVSEAGSVQLPNIPALCRRVQRVRGKHNPQLPTPANRESLIIPDSFQLTKGELKANSFCFMIVGVLIVF